MSDPVQKSNIKIVERGKTNAPTTKPPPPTHHAHPPPRTHPPTHSLLNTNKIISHVIQLHINHVKLTSILFVT